MTVKDLIQKNDYLGNADVFIFINPRDELVNFTVKNPLDFPKLSGLEVLSFNYLDVCSKPFHNRYRSKFSTSKKGKPLLEILDRLHIGANAAIIKYNETIGCFVIIEKYYNDGTHSTTAKALAVNPDFISESFESDENCDTFIKPVENAEAGWTYLHSKFYIDLVEKRTKNRLAKVIVEKKDV